MLAPSRPYGAVIRPGSPIKLKGAVLLQAPGQWPFWAQFWRDWDWTTIKRTIDNLATLGVNCLQVTATGVDDGYPVVTHPDVPTMRSHISQLAAYAASKGMVLNPQLGYQAQVSFATPQGTGSVPNANLVSGTAAAVSMARLFAEQPNVAFVDGMNEVNIFPPWGSAAQAATDMGYFCSQVRTVLGAIPLNLSVGCSNLSDVTGPWMQALAPLCDFHNVHTYFYSDAGGMLSPSNFTALRSASWYQGRFVVGETGMPSQNGASAQTAWLNSNGTIAAAADCLGSILWGATDTSSGSSPTENYNVSNFGLMDSTGTTLRSALSVPVAAWPGAL